MYFHTLWLFLIKLLNKHNRTQKQKQGAQARAYLHEEACTVARRPRPLFDLRFVAHSLIFTDLEQQGAGNQGKKRFRSLLRQFAGTPPALLLERMFSSGSTPEPERFGKVRPLGSKGSNPLQGI